MQVALFGLIFLGDKITPLSAVAILIATAGVIVMSLKPGAGSVSTKRSTLHRPLVAARCSRSRRSAIAAPSSSLHLPHFVMAATFTLAVGLVMQAALLSALSRAARSEGAARHRAAWRPSLFAGFMGAFASEFWFLAFAIATAASVRTLALVEVLFAQGVTHFVFKQPTTAREGVGIVLVVIGVALLVWAY